MTNERPGTGSWLLAIDSSTDEAGIALSDGLAGAETNWTASRDQTVTVLDQVDRLLSLIGIQPADLAAVAIATGPGMFNGLRVGMSVAKGLVLGMGMQLIGVSTLDATAQPFAVAGLPVIATVAAGRGRLVWAIYQPDGRGGLAQRDEARNGVVEELAEIAAGWPDGVIICGELTESQVATVQRNGRVRIPSASVRKRRAAVVAELARARFLRGETDDPVALEPVYLHAARRSAAASS